MTIFQLPNITLLSFLGFLVAWFLGFCDVLTLCINLRIIARCIFSIGKLLLLLGSIWSISPWFTAKYVGTMGHKMIQSSNAFMLEA